MESPVPEKTLNFSEALDQLKIGKKITKKEWNNLNEYGFLLNGQVTLHKSDDKLYSWIINDGDLMGEDWVVINE